MKKITICSSIKFKTSIVEAVRLMEAAGMQPLFPELKKPFIHNPTAEQKHQLAKNHFQSIDKSDAVYFVTEGGYMGTNCKLELGYSIGLGKDIYFSEPTNDDALDCWVKAFVPIAEINKNSFS